MPVQDKPPYIAHIANGATSYTYDFRIFKDTNLVVTVAGVQKTLATDYTVTGVGNDGGGAVVFTVPQTGGGTVEIERVLPVSRETDYQYAGGFREQTVDDDQDYQTMLAQQVRAGVDRAVKVPKGQAGETLSLADHANRFGKVLGWNSLGKFTTMAMNFVTSSGLLANPWADVRGYASLADAVAQLGGLSIDLVIYGLHTITDNLTIPANIRLVVKNGGLIDIATGKVLTINGPFEAGMYQVFSGSGNVSFGASSIAAIYPEWRGGGIGVVAATNTSALQWAIDSQIPVYLQSGTYDYVPPLRISKDSVRVTGAGRYLTILKPTAIAVNALEIGTTASVSGIVLRDFKLQGNTTCTNGILIGNQAPQYYAIGCDYERLSVSSFAGAGAAGIKVVTAWWSNFTTINWEGNYNNFHIPAGAVTTTLNIGGNSTIRNALNIGILTEGAATVDVLTLRDASFEYNAKGAINAASTKAILNLENCYFEQNSATGSGVITVTGGSGPYDYTMLTMRQCVSDVPLSGYAISLNYVKKSYIEDCSGFLAGTGIITTINCDIQFRNMNGQSAADFLSVARSLLGTIRAEEYIPSQGKWESYCSNGNHFEGHIGTYQPAAPTVTIGAQAGTSASVTLAANATDTAGRIQLTTGTGSVSTGQYARITFNKTYNRVPRVFLSMGSGSTAATARMYVTETAGYFDLEFAVAEMINTTLYINYLVIE